MRTRGAAAVKGSLRGLCLAMVTIWGAVDAMAIEEAAYTVTARDGAFEMRDYAPHVVAETLVEGTLEEAGNKAFNRLFGYISGGNRSREKVAMTAPVSQRPQGEKIADDGAGGAAARPGAVGRELHDAGLLDAGNPPDPGRPAGRAAPGPGPQDGGGALLRVLERAGVSHHLEKLESWMRGKGLAPAGDPVWARYNSPFSLWFLRRNEILIPVATDAR